MGIAVPDLDEAIAFYRDAFGMGVVHEETNEEQGVREAMVAVGDSGSCIQLLAPLYADSTIAKFLDRSGPGMQQLAYRVDRRRRRPAALRERGVRLLYDEPRRGTSGSGSTSSTPRTPAACWSSWSSPPDPPSRAPGTAELRLRHVPGRVREAQLAYAGRNRHGAC